MRKVTYSAAVSLNSYIAGPDEAIDWIVRSDDVAAIMKEAWAGVAAVLMGRKTWEFAVRSGGSGSSPKTRTCTTGPWRLSRTGLERIGHCFPGIAGLNLRVTTFPRAAIGRPGRGLRGGALTNGNSM